MKTILKLSFLATILIFCKFAYAAPGGLLWEDFYDREGAMYDVALTNAIAVQGNRVFVAGATETSAGGYAFSVRAYSVKDGSLLWGDYYDREGSAHDEANAIAVQGNRVFVAGLTRTSAGGYAFTVRAYSVKDGSVLWEDYYDREGALDDWAYAIAVQGTKVFVAGGTETSAGGYAFTVRAYSVKNGSILWEDDYDREGALDDWAYAIAVQGTRVFVAGRTETSVGDSAFSVRAYSVKDGSLLWGDYYDREGDLDDLATAVAVQGTKVFVAGLTETSVGDSAFSVRAYSVKDGSVLWEDFYDREGSGYDVAHAIAVQGTRVFVAGSTETSVGDSDFSVRAYSVKDGSILWEDYYDREGFGYDVAHAIAVQGTRVFVAGETQKAGDSAFSVRAYSVKDGSVLWEDFYDREGLYDVANAIAVQGNRIFVAGLTLTSAGGYAFTVRTHSTK